MIVEFEESSYIDLIQILEEKYYNTIEINELQKINQIYKQLKFKSENWLSNIQRE